jgi:hypothetical protein
MFSFFSVIECPGCSKPLPVSDIGFANEPVLVPVTCSKCGKEWQVRKDQINGMEIEERKFS